ncbi:HNH endonuclease [Mesorhizobium sp. C120A]|uniref:HNH endonuclease n=1 Tax=unclassified Mesorhizobium TaxID=325217 RepID=UPI0003D02884|nr:MULTISPECIES: HNH endonuclease [unclassified Mesorhizobium]ESZ60498.1 Fis family transcriptional regulator [Mesorhizobium sp. L103C120A0]WJI43669.1 HNH endonuclease [Mesorhizobium sp. C120A]
MAGTITAERLRELLHYDPQTGVFTWLVSPGKSVKAGAVAGRTPDFDGYGTIRIDRRLHKAHRLAWLYMTGEFPAGQIDHANCDKLDNRISNLRPASNNQNMFNRPGFSKIGRLKGVNRKRSGRWGAEVVADGVRHYLGTYDTEEEAHATYTAAARELHGSFAYTHGSV